MAGQNVEKSPNAGSSYQARDHSFSFDSQEEYKMLCEFIEALKLEEQRLKSRNIDPIFNVEVFEKLRRLTSNVNSPADISSRLEEIRSFVDTHPPFLNQTGGGVRTVHAGRSQVSPVASRATSVTSQAGKIPSSLASHCPVVVS